MIKAIIYDMDDLMVNSDPSHNIAWEKLLKDYNHKFSDFSEEFRSKCIGMRVIDICKNIINYLKIDVNLDDFYNRRIQLFFDIIKNELKIMPGLIESLNTFKLNKYKIALASSGTKQYIDLVLDRVNIRDYFDVIVSGDCVNVGKPHPKTYIIAAEKLNCKPEECIVLEDATNGINAAINAGCKCIAIKNPNTPPQDYSNADLILNSLKDITINKIKKIR